MNQVNNQVMNQANNVLSINEKEMEMIKIWEEILINREYQIFYYKCKFGNKYWYIKLWEENEVNEVNKRIIFDDVKKLKEIGNKYYYKTRIWDKYWYITLWEENEKDNKIIFDDVKDIEEINWNIFYKARIWNKRWYIKAGEENKAKRRIKFEYVKELKEIKWKLYFNVSIWKKTWYVKLWRENKLLNLRLIDNKYYYESKIKNKKAWIAL